MNKMDIFLSHLSMKSHSLVNILKYLSEGYGYQLGEIMIEFANSPDPYHFIDYPELKDFDGVGFYCPYDSPPLLVDGKEFYKKFKKIVEEMIESEDNTFQNEVMSYLEIIRKRCCSKPNNQEE